MHESVKALDQGCQLPRRALSQALTREIMRIGYGAAGPCSSVGNGAGPLINGTAIIGVVVALVGPAAVELALLTIKAGSACCWPIATDNAPIATTPLAPITATSSLALLGVGESIIGTPHLPGFQRSPLQHGDQ